MHYPWWYVPLLTSPMLIALIAVLHIYVAMYAVGGGLFLAVETSYAYRTHNQPYLAYLRRHAGFFILLTVVLGAITGVGIWWTIGLASPLATEHLIHIFVFAWAIEYVFFLLEIVSAFIFYYAWNRLDPRTHTTVGWIYAVSAWLSLVVISAIVAFMLNAGSWPQHPTFWVACLNPQFLPQTLTRTGGCLLLASLYVYLHASLRLPDSALRHLISARSARPAMLGAAMVTVGGLWWYLALPPSAQAALAVASPLNILSALILAVTVLTFVMLYLGPYRNPGWVTPGFAILIFTIGLAATGTGEFIREAVRKPFIVYDVVLSNQVLPQELPTLRQTGLLEAGAWTKPYVSTNYPQLLNDQGRIDPASLAALPQPARLDLGRVLFHYQCNDCHALREGYSPLAQLIRGWTPHMIHLVVQHPDQNHFFMPPYSGSPQEAQLLTDYLYSIARPFPPGLPTAHQP
jgi:cytochrome d ubiquinol oxidase subunit I